MTSSKVKCSHCGETFEAADNAHVYSVTVDSRGFLLQVIEGELLPENLHYCSQTCMFNRRQGILPEDDLFSFASAMAGAFGT